MELFTIGQSLEVKKMDKTEYILEQLKKLFLLPEEERIQSIAKRIANAINKGEIDLEDLVKNDISHFYDIEIG